MTKTKKMMKNIILLKNENDKSRLLKPKNLSKYEYIHRTNTFNNKAEIISNLTN